MSFDVINEDGALVKMWTQGVPVEEGAIHQLKNVARLPFIYKWIAAMPDVHVGMGATIGSVIPTIDAIIPSAVGVDIGCVDANSEFLSPTGWVRVADYDGGRVMQYDPDTGEGALVEPIAFIRRPSKGFLHFHTKYGINQMLSPDHRALCWRITGRDRRRVREVISAGALAKEHGRLVLGAKVEFETTFKPQMTTSLALSDEQLRVQTMVNADGHLDGKAVVLNFKKERKIDRAQQLLDAAGISHTRKDYTDRTTFRCVPPVLTRTYAGFWEASLEQLQIITEECLHWDGNLKDRCFFTRDAPSANFIHYAFSACGQRAVLRMDPHPRDGKLDYRVFGHPNTKVGLAGVPKTPVDRVPSSDGLEYCFKVPTGFWVMRRGGNIVMTGNCGMMAVRTELTADAFPQHTHDRLFNEIGKHVPHGRTDNGGKHDRGAWGNLPPAVETAWMGLEPGWKKIVSRQKRIGGRVNTGRHLGTLGTGNHFIEVCLDLEQRVWLMVHSGSRGVGGRIGMYFTKLAQADMKRYFINLTDRDLAYIPAGTDAFSDYVASVRWAQQFAKVNRELMMANVRKAVRKVVGHRFEIDFEVDCHHNYVEQERHYGKTVWLTRKGAINAELDQWGIIPGSMGERSFIVQGNGCREAFNSCSHGAGRLMSRGDAKRKFTLKEHRARTEGVACRKDGTVLDETPGAYKDIDAVMAAQGDLVRPVHQLKQFVCVKG